jgi:peptidyl-prolyl cis-trans isomerase D
VAARWREQEIAKRLNAKADEILEKLKAGTALAEVAAADHLKVKTLSGIKRAAVSPPLSAAVVETIFRTPKDANARGDAAQGGNQLVFRVTDIVVPPLEAESDNSKRVVEVLNRALSEDVLTQYIAQLESEMGVTFNQSALHQVISGGADTGDAD